MLLYELELACARCQANNKGEDCKHKLHMVPPWKSVEKRDINKEILRGNLDILKQESM